MELLLNLAWLVLVLPACWLWRHSRSVHREGSFRSWQALLALGCVLVILFPVISATDDLMAMRTEMEESPVSKRSIRQASHDKASIWNSRVQDLPATPGVPESIALSAKGGDLPPRPFFSFPASPSVPNAGRAPPAACLA